MNTVLFPMIPENEYRGRINKCQQLLKQNDLDALVLYDPENLRYYAGYNKMGMGVEKRWRVAFIIPRDGSPVFLTPYVTEAGVRLQLWPDDIRGWGGPSQLAYAQAHETLCADVLKGLNARRVAIELGHSMNSFLSISEYGALTNAASGVTFVDACELIWQQRMIKSAFEQKIIRELHTKYVRALNNSRKVLREGITEIEYEQAIYEEFTRQGLLQGAVISRMLMSGPGRYHGMIMGATNTPLKKGDTLWFDGGPRYRNYWSDVQRDICIGKPTPKIQRLWDAAFAGQQEALAAVKPGVRVSEIWDAGQRGIDRLGEFVRPSTRCGHGIGISSHEPPLLQSAEMLQTIGEKDYELEPGMYLCVEVGVKDPDNEVAFMWPEDQLIVTEKGYELLTRDLPLELWVVE